MASKGLLARLPVHDTFFGLSHRGVALAVTPLLCLVAAVEAAWDAYVLAQFTDGLTTFRKIFSGLNVAFLAVLVLALLYFWFAALLPANARRIAILAHIACLKGLILFFVGLLHLISVVRKQSDFTGDCAQTYSAAFCDTLNDVNIGFAVGLWLLQEALLVVLAVTANAFVVQHNTHTLPVASNYAVPPQYK